MDLRHLKYFLAVAEELNIGRAAARLHISQPPLTRQMKDLEEELRVELFVRTPKGVELTQAGEMLKEEARNICMLVEAATDRARRAGEGRLGRLDVGIFGSGIYGAIPAVLEAFRARLPGVSVVLHTMNKSEQIDALRQRRITVGFNRMTPPLPDIGRELVTTERVLVALHEGHALARQASVSLRALREVPLVLFPSVGRPNFVDKVIELCKRQGFEPQVAQEVGDAVTGIALVAAGYGASLIPESLTTLKMPRVVYLPITDAPQAFVDLSVLYRATDNSPLLRALLEVVREFREWQEKAKHAAAAAAMPPTTHS